MKRKRHTPEQIIRKLRTAEQPLNQVQSVADVCRALGRRRRVRASSQASNNHPGLPE
jgi:hypothetical protein